ncbi:MAG: aldo/keto reductase, partial [Gemmatimonadaceae bacterium]
LLSRPRERSKGETTRSTSDDIADRLYSASNGNVIDAVERVANERGISMAQVALAWLLSKPEVTAPIVGATTLSHLEGAIGALEIKLTADEIAALEAPYTPRMPTF